MYEQVIGWLTIVFVTGGLAAIYAPAAWRTRPSASNPNARPGEFAHSVATVMLGIWFGLKTMAPMIGRQYPGAMLLASVAVLGGWSLAWLFAQRESMRELWLRDPASVVVRLRRGHWYGIGAACSIAFCAIALAVYLFASVRIALGLVLVFSIPAVWFGAVWLAYVSNARAVRTWQRKEPVTPEIQSGAASGER